MSNQPPRLVWLAQSVTLVHVVASNGGEALALAADAIARGQVESENLQVQLVGPYEQGLAKNPLIFPFAHEDEDQAQ